jgi:hypothetical protein
MTFVLSPPNDLLVFESFIVVGEMDVDSPVCADQGRLAEATQFG